MSDPRSDAPTSSFPVLGGYEVLAELYRDRLGVVYRARQLLYHRDVALRLVDERARGPANVARDTTGILHDAEAAARLAHPGVVAVLDCGEDEGQLYLAAELPPGPTLRQRLAAAPLAPAEAAGLVASVARTLQHLHDHHALHLGLTSAAVFLAADGSPRLGDLGLVGLLQHHPGVPFPGDPACAAPEQRGGSRAEPRTDVYALGGLLHECLTGRLPADGTHLRNYPPALARICHKALATTPQRRHGSAAELADELEAFQQGKAPTPGLPTRLVESARRNPAVAALTVAVALTLITAVAVGTWLAAQASQAHSEAQQRRDEAEQAAEQVQAARKERDEAARRNTLLVRAADHGAHAARLERDEQRKRAIKEGERRRQAEKQSRDEAELRGKAEERARDADDARQAAETARVATSRQLAGLHVSHGAALMDAGDLSGALLPFVRALAMAQRDKLPEDAHRLRLAVVLSRCPRPLCVLGYPRGDVTSVLFSPSGERLASVGVDGVIKVRSALTGTLVGRPLVHGALVATAVFSGDSKRLLTADRMGQLRLWNVEDGSEIFDAVTLEAVPVHVGFSGDGKRLVTVTSVMADEPAGQVQVRDAASGETVGQAITAQVAPRPAALSPDGKRVVVCCTDQAARSHDVQTGKQVGPALRHGGDITAVTMSRDGQLILTDDGSKARVWAAATGKPTIEPIHYSSRSIAAQIDDSGKLVLTADNDGSVAIHDTSTGKRQGPTLRPRATLGQAVLSPDGRQVLLAGADGVVLRSHVFASSGRSALPLLVPGRPLRHLALSADGTRALTFDGQGVIVWDLTAGEPLSPTELPIEEGVTYSADARRLARIGGDSVQVHDAGSGKAVGAAMKHKGEVKEVVFSPKGDLVLTVANPPEGKPGTPTWDVRVWDAGTGKPISEVMEHLREVKQAHFAAGGARVLTVALDKRVRMWDAKTGKQTCKALEHDEDVVLAELSPNGLYVVTADVPGVTRAWEAATGRRLGEPMSHAAAVKFVAFDGASKFLATCCEDGTARAWELGTGRRLAEVEHGAAVLHASFSPDGKLLLTGSADGTARAWSMDDGKPRTPPLRHDEGVQQTGFSETGRWLLTAAGRFVRLWDAQTGEPIGPPLPHSANPTAVTRMSFSKAGELVTEAGAGTRWARALVGDRRTAADLAALARVLSGRDEVGAGQFAAVGARDLESAWEKAVARHRAEFQPARPAQLAWARRGAAECETFGLWVGALRHLDVLLEESASPALHARRGKARARVGLHEGALADYSKALEKENSRWQWWAGRAEAAAALKRWDRATEDYGRAAKLEPRRAELWLGLGRAQAQRGRWKEAAEALGNFLRHGGDNPEALSEHALAQLSTGDGAGYRRTCARLVKKFAAGSGSAARRSTADACVLAPDAVPDFKRLLAEAEKVVREAPDDVEEQARLAALFLRAGQAARAVTLLEKVTAVEQARPADRWLLVLAHHGAGQKEKAKEALAKATMAKVPAAATWQERQAVALLRKEAEAAVKAGE
jgi:WD40 repeat protein/tetratricopeptide (TPR) repeat protein